MNTEDFSTEEWANMARLFAYNRLNAEGIALVNKHIKEDSNYFYIVLGERIKYKKEKEAQEMNRAEAIENSVQKKLYEINKKKEAKKGIIVRTVSRVLLPALFIAAFVFVFNYYNARHEKLAKARELEKQRIAAAKKQRIQDSLARVANNRVPSSKSIGSTTQNIAKNSHGQSVSSGVATTNLGQSQDSVGSQQSVPTESGKAGQAKFVATVNVPYQGGNSFTGDQSNRSIRLELYQIKTGKERYTLEGKMLTVYLSQENLNVITAGGTNDLLVRKSDETLMYIRKDGKEILELEDGQVSSIK